MAAHRRALAAALILLGATFVASPVRGQTPRPDSSVGTLTPKPAADSARTTQRRFRQRMTAGFLSSLVLHEAGHFVASYAMGFHPHLGTDKGRPTVFSGIDDVKDSHSQFIFSAAGLGVQDILDEMILDVPHRRGSAFERGLLAGGLGTTLFYVTIGRNASVSDISVMARTSSLSKTELSLIFGSVAALHAVRIGRDHHYAHFFAVPSERGLKTGVSLLAN